MAGIGTPAGELCWPAFEYPTLALVSSENQMDGPPDEARLQIVDVKSYDGAEGVDMASLDWSQCAAVESVPGKVSGAWVFRGTRMPVQTVFDNLEAGMSVEEITEVFDVTPEEVKAVLHFASESLANAPVLGR